MLFFKRDLSALCCFKTLLKFERDFLRAFAHPLQHITDFGSEEDVELDEQVDLEAGEGQYEDPEVEA